MDNSFSFLPVSKGVRLKCFRDFDVQCIPLPKCLGCDGDYQQSCCVELMEQMNVGDITRMWAQYFATFIAKPVWSDYLFVALGGFSYGFYCKKK